jgi:tryprostatin B 6-hydroxylase
MDSLPQGPLLLAVLSVGLGVVSHLTYFIHGEHHNSAPTLAVLCGIVPVLLYIGQVFYMDTQISQAARNTATIYISYFAGLWTSIIIYRVFFHRLNGFPGPFMAKVSKLWHVYQVIPKSDNRLVIDRLHKTYGPFVRTG